jgi:hypothetical protein
MNRLIMETVWFGSRIVTSYKENFIDDVWEPVALDENDFKDLDLC